MTHPVSLFGAAALGIVLASSCAAGADGSSPRRSIRPRAGRQITVRQGVEPWLTLGTWAPVGSRQGYALDTLRPPQRNTVQGTFVGMRGNDRLPNDVSLPEANRPLITVSCARLERALVRLVLTKARPRVRGVLRARDFC